MAYRIVVSERAEKNLDEIVAYLRKEWSKRISDQYIILLTKKIKFISSHPLMYPPSAVKKGIRKCIINKQTVLYYRVIKEEIEIVTIQFSKQDPRKLTL